MEFVRQEIFLFGLLFILVAGLAFSLRLAIGLYRRRGFRDLRFQIAVVLSFIIGFLIVHLGFAVFAIFAFRQ